MKKYILCIIATLMMTSLAVGQVTTFYWTPPTTNEDGSPLTNLAGYNFYCGDAPASYMTPVDIGLPPIHEYLIESILGNVEGDFYCAMTAYDDSRNESVMSEEITFKFDNIGPASCSGLGVK